MAETKNYVGNGKAITNTYGTMYNISLKKELIEKLLNSQEGNYIKICMSELKQVGKYGETHTLYENTWKPTPQATNANEDIAEAKEDLTNDSLPF